MTYSDAQHLLSEIHTVQEFLAELGDDAIIERLTWQHRLAVLHERLSQAAASPLAHPLALAEADLHEDHEQHVGTLLGVLPEERRFEVRLQDNRVVRGQIDASIEDVNAFKRNWLDVAATLHFRVVRSGSGTRYVLTGAAAVPGEGV